MPSLLLIMESNNMSMTKAQLYNALVGMGVKNLKAVRSYDLGELQKLYKAEQAKINGTGGGEENTDVGTGTEATTDDNGVDHDDKYSVYSFLDGKGIRLNSIEEYTIEQLLKLYEKYLEAERQAQIKADEEAEAEEKRNATAKAPKILKLTFVNSGWCEELGKSYLKGKYKCKDRAEYDALKPFAENK